MQFSLNTAFLSTALAAIVLGSVTFFGQQAFFVATLPALTVLGMWYLLRHRLTRSAAVLAITYLGLWALTSTMGVSDLKRKVQRRYEENGIPNVVQMAKQDPTYSLVPTSIRSPLIKNTPGPWYHLDVIAVPCPLIIVAEEGAVNHINSGPEGRTISLWYGVNLNEISWLCYWWSN